MVQRDELGRTVDQGGRPAIRARRESDSSEHVLMLQSKRANFDATHELEELLLEENPLKAKKRKEGQDVEQMSPEMRMMEQQWVQL